MRKFYKLFELSKFIEYQNDFYDLIIKEKNLKKLDLLNELNIPYTSYNRVVSRKGGININEYINKLEKRFEITPLNKNIIEDFNTLLTPIIYNLYYRSDECSKYIDILEKNIAINNSLLPLYELLLAYTKIMKNASNLYFYNNYLNDNIIRFKNLYNHSPFNEIYTFVVAISRRDSLMELDYDTPNRNLKGPIYFAYTFNAYYNKRYDLVNYYATNARKHLILSNNIYRLNIINVLYMKSLINLGIYEECINIGIYQFISMYEMHLFKNPFVETKKCLYYCYYKLNLKDNFLQFLKYTQTMDFLDVIFLLMIDKNNELSEKYLNLKYLDTSNEFTDDEKIKIKTLVNYINKKNNRSIGIKKDLKFLNELLNVI